MGLITLVNITAIVLLWPWARVGLADYDQSLAAGRIPRFATAGHTDPPPTRSDLVWSRGGVVGSAPPYGQ